MARGRDWRDKRRAALGGGGDTIKVTIKCTIHGQSLGDDAVRAGLRTQGAKRELERRGARGIVTSPEGRLRTLRSVEDSRTRSRDGSTTETACQVRVGMKERKHSQASLPFMQAGLREPGAARPGAGAVPFQVGCW